MKHTIIRSRKPYVFGKLDCEVCCFQRFYPITFQGIPDESLCKLLLNMSLVVFSCLSSRVTSMYFANPALITNRDIKSASISEIPPRKCPCTLYLDAFTQTHHGRKHPTIGIQTPYGCTNQNASHFLSSTFLSMQLLMKWDAINQLLNMLSSIMTMKLLWSASSIPDVLIRQQRRMLDILSSWRRGIMIFLFVISSIYLAFQSPQRQRRVDARGQPNQPLLTL